MPISISMQKKKITIAMKQQRKKSKFSNYINIIWFQTEIKEKKKIKISKIKKNYMQSYVHKLKSQFPTTTYSCKNTK